MTDNYFEKNGRKGRLVNVPGKGSGKLSKNGQVYRNDLLNTDYTSQRAVVKKTKGV